MLQMFIIRLGENGDVILMQEHRQKSASGRQLNALAHILKG
jgi:hypothetical protein